MAIMMMPIKYLQPDHQGIRCREYVADDPLIGQYVNLTANGVKLPPITAWGTTRLAYISDGWLRYWARLRIGLPNIEVDLTLETRKWAIMQAAGANVEQRYNVRTERDRDIAIWNVYCAVRHLRDDQRPDCPAIARLCGATEDNVIKVMHDMGITDLRGKVVHKRQTMLLLAAPAPDEAKPVPRRASVKQIPEKKIILPATGALRVSEKITNELKNIHPTDLHRNAALRLIQLQLDAMRQQVTPAVTKSRKRAR